MGRTILGILAGMVTAWVLIMACQFASGMLYPPPPGITFEVETPTRLSKEQKAILERFRDTETGDECPASKGFFSRIREKLGG